MPKKPLPYVLAFFTFVFAVLAWWLVHRAIVEFGYSSLIYALSAVSLLAGFVCLDVILIREGYFLVGVLVLSLLASFIFSQSPYNALAILLAFVMLIWTKESVKNDLASSLRVRIGKSLEQGLYPLVIGLSVIIVSLFFSVISTYDTQQLTPTFKKNWVTNWMLKAVLARMNPEFGKMDSTELSVDEIITQIQVQQASEAATPKTTGSVSRVDDLIEAQLGEQFSPIQKEKLRGVMDIMYGKVAEGNDVILAKEQELFRDVWKTQLSEMVGFKIQGDEKAADVFVAIVNARIGQTISATSDAGKKTPLLPSALSIALFLTLIPLGSILKHIWKALARGLFWILKAFKVVKIVEIQKEAQEIDY